MTHKASALLGTAALALVASVGSAAPFDTGQLANDRSFFSSDSTCHQDRTARPRRSTGAYDLVTGRNPIEGCYYEIGVASAVGVEPNAYAFARSWNRLPNRSGPERMNPKLAATSRSLQ